MTAARRPPLAVGFDLDLTLVDSRPGIHATYCALCARTGVFIDADAAVGRLGPPLEEELARWFPADRIVAAADEFRALYPEHAVTCSPVLPGGREALACVRAYGGRIVVITGKFEPNARRHLDHLGLVVDAVIGWVWGPGKTDALLAHGVGVYVGDHPADMAAATAANSSTAAANTAAGSEILDDPCGPGDADHPRSAERARVVGVGVGTGGWSAAELRHAGATVVLNDLTEFPAWFEAHVRANGRVAA